jgi:hypothetical protein
VLVLKVGVDEDVGGVGELQLQIAAEHAAGSLGAVDEKDELGGQRCGVADFELRADFQELGVQSFFVFDGDAAARMAGLHVVGGGMQEGAAAIAGPNGALGHCGENGAELFARLAGMLSHDVVKPLPIFFVALFEAGGNEFVFGLEVTVETHFGDAGLGDDGVDADGAGALFVEKAVGGFKDAFAGGFCGGGFGMWFGSHNGS